MSGEQGNSYWERMLARRGGRRQVLRAGAGAAASGAALVAACGGTRGGSQAPSQPASSSTGNVVAGGTPKTGGQLRHILPYSAGNIDPHMTEDYVGYGFVEGYWYEPVVNLDYGDGTVDWRIAMKVIPWLAAKIEQPDPATAVLTIRQGVKWHNGDPLTADDVTFSFKRMMAPDPNVTAAIKGYVAHINSVDTVDDQTVRFTAKSPDADFLIYLAQRNCAIAPAKVLQSGQSLSKQAIGTGPFRLASYTKDGSATATRYEGYWQQGHPYMDGIKMTLHADDATMGAAFAAGQTDIITRTDKAQADPLLKANPKARFRRFFEDQIQGITFNETKPPFNDLRVRQAIHLAMDRQEANKAVTFDEGAISGPVVVTGKTGWFIPTDDLLKLPGYRQPKDQDIAQAKQLLAAAGFPSGFKTTLGYKPAESVTPADSQVVQAQLKKIGVDVDLVGLDNAAYVSNRSKGDYDILMIVEGLMSLPANVLNTVFYSKSIYGRPAGINDSQLDSLIESQVTEFDFSKRGQIYQQIEHRILDQVHEAPIGTPSVYVLQQPWVNDWVDNRSSRQAVMNPSTIWLDVNLARQMGQQL
jgi:peptide/nickel transport system substrate-binding protein